MSNIQEVLPASGFLKKNLGISEIPNEAYFNYGYALLAITGADGTERFQNPNLTG